MHVNELDIQIPKYIRTSKLHVVEHTFIISCQLKKRPGIEYVAQ